MAHCAMSEVLIVRDYGYDQVAFFRWLTSQELPLQQVTTDRENPEPTGPQFRDDDPEVLCLNLPTTKPLPPAAYFAEL
jgi:hypothetical protein